MPHLLSSPTGGKDVRHGRFLLSEQICGTIDGFSFGLAWGGINGGRLYYLPILKKGYLLFFSGGKAG
jgi:hypothetical protein